MHADANLNVLRVWGRELSERTPFYDACDELGIAGHAETCRSPVSTIPIPARGMERGLSCMRAGQHQTPPEPSEPPFLVSRERGEPASRTSWRSSKATLRATGAMRLTERGSSCRSRPTFRAARTTLTRTAHMASYLRNSSSVIGLLIRSTPIGSVGTPTYESMQRFMPPDALKKFPKECQPYDQLNAVWQHHDYIPYFDKDECPVDQIAIYGAVCNTEEFCYRAQLANYIQYRALFEGFSALMWNWYAGVFLWKSQSPWPGLRGQLYDWSRADGWSLRCAPSMRAGAHPARPRKTRGHGGEHLLRGIRGQRYGLYL